MARIKYPYIKIFRTRNTFTPPFKEPGNESRAYKRVDGKFIPIGWYVEWSDGKEQVILDKDI
tara:strand:- start:175 stop:360 length:186 start_codon:yes stop_codon:yes gene_type:complete